MISDKDLRFLQLAMKVALRSSFHKQVGVVFVKGSRVIVEGVNRISHPKYLEYPGIDGLHYWSLHAEIDALARVDDVRRTIVYLYGIKNGHKGNSKPCPLCFKYLQSRGVRRIVHTTPTGDEAEIVLK